MVIGPGQRRGAGSFGCLVSLVLLAAAVYYGIHLGGVYWRFYELRDDMRQQARLASQYSDDVIRAHLTAVGDSIFGESPNFVVTRDGRPTRITIETEYSETLKLPLLTKPLVLHPRVEEPL